MGAERFLSRFRWRIAFAAIAVALGLLIGPSTATAQPGDDLLRVLKPWIKRQLLGGDKPAREAVPSEDLESPGPEAEESPAAEAAEPSGGTQTAGETAQEGDLADTVADDSAGEDISADDAADDAAEGAPEESLITREEAPATGTLPEPVEIPPEPIDLGPPPLRFAVLAGRSASATMAAVGPIADDIGAAIDRPVELLAMPSYAAMIGAQVERRIDGGFYSASAFALADSRCDCLEPLAAPRAWDGTVAYHAVIVARADSGIASAFDLEGKTIAAGAPDSIGARRMQLAGLMASGIDPAATFAGVIEVPSAVDAVRLVMDGAADAAFAWSSLEGDAAGGYSRGTLTRLVANGEIAMRDVGIVWRSAPIAHGPFAVLDTLSDDDKDRIAALLVALEATRPEAYDMLNPFYAGGYAPVDADDYAGLQTLTAQNVDALRLPKAVAEVAAPEEETPQAPAAN